MNPTLDSTYRKVAECIPHGPFGEPDFVFTSEVVPAPPRLLTSERLFVRRGTRDYNASYRSDVLDFFVDPHGAHLLGTWVLSCMLCGTQPTSLLQLTHPRSDIREIELTLPLTSPEDPSPGLSVQAAAFRYWPAERSKHPFLDDRAPQNDLPGVSLTSEPMPVTDEEWKHRDRVEIWPNLPGLARLAALLLDAGSSFNRQLEFDLEGPGGLQGVGPLSSEVRLVLPGAVGWPAEDS